MIVVVIIVGIALYYRSSRARSSVHFISDGRTDTYLSREFFFSPVYLVLVRFAAPVLFRRRRRRRLGA